MKNLTNKMKNLKKSEMIKVVGGAKPQTEAQVVIAGNRRYR